MGSNRTEPVAEGYWLYAGGCSFFLNLFDCRYDADIARAAAKVTGEFKPHARLVDIRQTRKNIAAGNQHRRGTVTALEGVVGRKGFAQVDNDRIIPQTLDCSDLRAVTSNGVSDARARR